MTFDDPMLIVLIVIGIALLVYAAAAIKIVSQFEKGLIDPPSAAGRRSGRRFGTWLTDSEWRADRAA